MTDDKQLVIFALFDHEMQKVLIDAFQQYGCPFDYQVVSSIKEAAKVLSEHRVHAIVMTQVEALLGDDGANGLIISQSNLPPTVTLIRPGDDYPYYLYRPYKNNDWVTLPFDLEELYVRINGVTTRASK